MCDVAKTYSFEAKRPEKLHGCERHEDCNEVRRSTPPSQFPRLQDQT